ncbi:DUF6146 family protein [Flavobacterium sp.]|jgi:hypothetical protein|uniref:DUF6146 family protein n=1 Tax=Flavobacterium sp. TaxID=239 RepID=UPI0022C569E0|nr:DUF6146 family protein [Flavobacterium sp.]MCZ8143696.1 DUF6146 family protein [Flavobacterium sp.]MCZ8366959.1 DUF6146 family protein [Flavobacterium sp.]
MKIGGVFIVFLFILWSCASTTPKSNTAAVAQNTSSGDTLRIANDSLEYEVIIIEPGFYGWLDSYARPRGYYSETFLESRNRVWVQEWNSRFNQGRRSKALQYEMRIDYDPKIHYGYEVNYLIYNFFIFYQLRHNERLGVFDVRP